MLASFCQYWPNFLKCKLNIFKVKIMKLHLIIYRAFTIDWKTLLFLNYFRYVGDFNCKNIQDKFFFPASINSTVKILFFYHRNSPNYDILNLEFGSFLALKIRWSILATNFPKFHEIRSIITQWVSAVELRKFYCFTSQSIDKILQRWLS